MHKGPVWHRQQRERGRLPRGVCAGTSRPLLPASRWGGGGDAAVHPSRRQVRFGLLVFESVVAAVLAIDNQHNRLQAATPPGLFHHPLISTQPQPPPNLQTHPTSPRKQAVRSHPAHLHPSQRPHPPPAAHPHRHRPVPPPHLWLPGGGAAGCAAGGAVLVQVQCGERWVWQPGAEVQVRVCVWWGNRTGWVDGVVWCGVVCGSFLAICGAVGVLKRSNCDESVEQQPLSQTHNPTYTTIPGCSISTPHYPPGCLQTRGVFPSSSNCQRATWSGWPRTGCQWWCRAWARGPSASQRSWSSWTRSVMGLTPC